MAEVSPSIEMTGQQATTAVDLAPENNVRRRRPDQLQHLGALAYIMLVQVDLSRW